MKEVAWLCKNNHVLGVIENVERSADGRTLKVTRLVLFRDAGLKDDRFSTGLAVGFDKLKQEPGEPTYHVIGRLVGTTEDIECSICGAKRTWHAGKAELDRLISMSRNGRKKSAAS